MPNIRTENHETLTPPTLKTILIQAALRNPPHIENGIDSIDLGKLAREAEDLSIESLRDPKGIERARPLMVTKTGKLLIANTETSGKKIKTGQRIEISSDSLGIKYYRTPLGNLEQDRVIAALMHSHGAPDLPPSPQDLKFLFRRKESVFLSPAVFVITPYQIMLIFRSKDTPILDEHELDSKIKSWTKMITHRMTIHFAKIPYITPKKEDEISARVQNALLRDIAKKYGLVLYSCNTDNGNIAHRVNQFQYLGDSDR